ncbi:hypothetical protein MYAM1_002754 [Malassezia yamatoensis]|uniref:Major facilitator superfamily (MFS) profile domain-containing protein n=1 Tax=Malassezia yamatoensis TaxID=253288 RepID=A0AAJ5YUH8_9BASI|nr:hypothetical protein MYAM1_002754 [Malassezia yamatoensis]
MPKEWFMTESKPSLDEEAAQQQRKENGAPQLQSVGPMEVPGTPDKKQTSPTRSAETLENVSAFKKSIKILIVVMASTSSFASPLSINIYMPAVPDISKDLDISSGETLLSVTTYLIFQGLSPSFWAPLSDTYGRRPILIATFVVYLAANLGLAFTNKFWLLLVLRMVQASGVSSAVSIGAGCISDVSNRKERGRYMGFYQLGTLLGPAVGPVIGGVFSQIFEWHAIFYFLSALSAVYLLVMVIALPESLRKLVGDGSLKARGIWRILLPLRLTVPDQQHNDKLMHSPPKVNIHSMGFGMPWRMFASLDLALMIYAFSIPFAVYSMVTSSLSTLLKSAYGYNAIETGLCFIPIGVASAIGSVVAGKTIDYEYAKAFRKHGHNLNLYYARLKYALVINLLYTAQTILVDLRPGRAASVTAAVNIGRCLVSAAFVAAVDYVIDDIGTGWTFTAFGLASLILTAPAIELVKRRGPEWNARREQRAENTTT